MLDRPPHQALGPQNGRQHHQLSVQSSHKQNDLEMRSRIALDLRLRFNGYERIDEAKACLSLLYFYSSILLSE